MLFPHGIFAFSFPIGRVITPQRAAVVGSDITPLADDVLHMDRLPR